MLEKQSVRTVHGLAEYGNRYVILAIVLSGVFMCVLDTNVVNIALPTITRDFGVDMAQSQWIVTAYLLASTSLLLIFGRISDYTGKVRLFFAGVIVFTLGSLACGLSPGINPLIFFRIIQGVGASIIYSINMAMIVQAFPRQERGRALGFIASTVAVGSIAGPILGGFLADTVGWQYIFIINVPIGIVLLVAAMKYLKLTETMSKRLDMDWAGAVSLVAGISAFILFLGSLADFRGFTMEMGIYLAVVLVSAGIFLLSESRHIRPVIDLSVFRVPAFSFASLSTMIGFTAFSMFIISMPFFLEISMGYTPSQVGQMLMAIPRITAVVAPLSGWLYDKFQSTYHSSTGMLISAIGLFSIGFAITTKDPVLILPCFAVFGLGNALFTSPNNTEVMSSLPPSRSSTASSVLATVQNFGNTVGISLVSIILYLSLRQSGFSGQIIGADPFFMMGAVQAVLVVCGILCLVGVGTSLMVGRRKGRQMARR